jgi:hypothetical protein
MTRAGKLITHIDNLSGDCDGYNREQRNDGSKALGRNGSDGKEHTKADVNLERVLRKAGKLDDGQREGLDGWGLHDCPMPR